MNWFRVYSEIKDDPKMLELDDHQRWLWICLLALASETRPRGVVKYVRLRGLALALRTDEERLTAALVSYGELGMVEHDAEHGTITICKWQERQYDKPSDRPEATRQRKQRSRQQGHADVTPESREVTPYKQTQTQTQTQTITDTDNKQTPPCNGNGHDARGGGDVDLTELDDAQRIAFEYVQEVAPDFNGLPEFIRSHDARLVAYWALAAGERIATLDNPAGLIRASVEKGSYPRLRGQLSERWKADMKQAHGWAGAY